MIEIKLMYEGDNKELRKLAAALLVLAGDEAHKLPAAVASAVPFKATDTWTAPPVAGEPLPIHAAGWKIAPNDVPDVGAEDGGPVVEADPALVFGHDRAGYQSGPVVEVDPAQVFGAGNAAAVSGFASSTSPVSSGAGLSNLSAAPRTSGAAAASGEKGNGQGATSPTPSGTPAVPNNGAVTGGVNVDSRGLPWDGRIHAGTKTTNKDGTWKKKPNVDPALVAQVETELRAVMAIPAPGNGRAMVPDLMPSAPAGAPATPPVPVPPPPPASAPGNVIPTPPASAPTTGVGASSSITSFAQLLPAVTNAMAAGTLTEQRVADVLAQHGVAVLPQLAPRPDLVQSVAAALFPVQ